MITPDDLTQFRNAISRFVLLTDADWNLLLPALQYRSLAKNECWIKEGRTATEIGWVLEGNMRHYYTVNGEEKTTYFYFENHFTGSYFSCITGKPSPLTFEALTDCRMIVFAYRKLCDLYDASKTWERFGRLLAEYLAMGLEERMVSLLTLSPEERYQQLLQGNKQKIMERIPQQYIASYLGITPVSLSRIRNRSAKS
ncbi:cAMP-binding domain of CRP or a regulatory subunit of cAMP-dependent protein kinases [Filimonas lacunae]|uniref:cAMP-binding domain of CRP or a regulatory subunit of cAMP-dependent protein kinases n=1 Tax=Filimonas lacunae TaxID=477680 RepID=A0A173MQN1_9BACT|nr:Crp/Fnr family transcriptional regulator [Filimonas lacunae]BAV09985.1 Crp/Fnr family transcriptional regulator [Filimonas lacunae]SIS82103.1 cAMP-binding domain of CRP or a regulatory subunit of cAMP-dependent protein kinases [Filimonas lacunae]